MMNSEKSMTLPTIGDAKVQDHLPPIAGKQRAAFNPVRIPTPARWAEALIPLERALTGKAKRSRLRMQGR